MAVPTPRLLPGHALMGNGAAFDESLNRVWEIGAGGSGYGLCECGQRSETSLHSEMARRQWHRQHKFEVANLAHQVGDVDL